MNKSFILFKICDEEIAIKLEHFIEVKENGTNDYIEYNSNKIKILKLDSLLELTLCGPHSVVAILNYKNKFFSIAVDQVLDTVDVEESKIKPLPEIINSTKSVISEVIIESSKITKILSLSFINNISETE
jgi:chemotaxis signal transduction protein